jgi:putative transposase
MYSTVNAPAKNHAMKEVRVRAERWRIHYNTIRPHSSLGYQSPAPGTSQHQIKTGYGEVESKVRFPLPHTLDGGEKSTKLAAR